MRYWFIINLIGSHFNINDVKRYNNVAYFYLFFYFYCQFKKNIYI